MPKSNWKGIISFGLVSIPVMLYPSRNKLADISFHQIDKKDNARIKYLRVNSNTGKVVPWENVIRGYEYDKETVIPVPDDVLKRVVGESARTIAISTFIDKKEFDYLMIDRFYYLLPDKNGQKGYVILRDALDEANKIGIARVIISTKEYVAALIPRQDALLLCLLLYDNEIKKPSEFEFPNKELSSYKITKNEINIAKQLINKMSSKWNPKKYVDEYQKIIHQWADAIVRHTPHPKTKTLPHKKMSKINFIDLLKKSLVSTKKDTQAEKKIHYVLKHHKFVKPKAKTTKHLTRH